MALGDDLKAYVKSVFGGTWATRDGEKVPASDDIKLANDAVKLDGTVLYADLGGSTALVDNYKNWFAAEVYKTYLYCAARIIRAEGGTITAYDGDRIMAVFIGSTKDTVATRAAFKINYATRKIVNSALRDAYGSKTDYKVSQTVGIDTSPLFVARTGIRGSNDLVWVGRAANHAAKLAGLSSDYPIRITKEVYGALANSMKTSNGKSMWEAANWTAMERTIYRSTWCWSVT